MINSRVNKLEKQYIYLSVYISTFEMSDDELSEEESSVSKDQNPFSFQEDEDNDDTPKAKPVHKKTKKRARVEDLDKVEKKKKTPSKSRVLQFLCKFSFVCDVNNKKDTRQKETKKEEG
jgi:hypothetical protein